MSTIPMSLRVAPTRMGLGAKQVFPKPAPLLPTKVTVARNICQVSRIRTNTLNRCHKMCAYSHGIDFYTRNERTK